MNKKQYTKWIVIAAAAVIVVCAVFILVRRSNDQRRQNEITALSREIQRREIELGRLKDELYGLEREEKKLLRCTGTMEVLFKEPDRAIYSTLLPKFSKYKAGGVIVLAGDQLPGMEGYLTEEEFRFLMEQGWEYCWRYDGEEDLLLWYGRLCSAAQSLGVPTTDSVLFAENCYQPERDAEFIRYGFKNLIYQGDYALSSQADLPDEAGILHIQLYELGSDEANAEKLNTLITNSENVALMLSLRHGTHYISAGDIIYALSTIWAPYINAGQMSICGFSEARTIQEENGRKRAVNESPFSEEYLRLQQQIEALDLEINDMRKRFEQL